MCLCIQPVGLNGFNMCSSPSSLLLKGTPCTQLCARMRLEQEGLGTAHFHAVQLGPVACLVFYNLKNCPARASPVVDIVFSSVLNLCVRGGVSGIPLSLCALGAKDKAHVLICVVHSSVSWIVDW